MSAKMSKITNKLLPYSAGYAVLTPLDENMKPMYDRAVATPPTYLTSSQFSESTTYEEVETGEGQNDNLPSARSATLTLTLSAFSPIFHAAASGKLEYLPDKALTAMEFETNLPETPEADTNVIQFKFGAGQEQTIEPAANSDGVYRFVIRDNHGNYLTKSTQAVLGTYVYDPDTKTLQFSEDYAGMLIHVIYDYEDENATVYRANPILKANKFLLETYGITQDAQTGATNKVKRSLRRCQVSGDLAAMPTQRSRSTSITYTFESVNVPTGISPWEEVWVPFDTGTLTGGDNDNRVNGCDDKFEETALPDTPGTGGDDVVDTE